MSKPLSADEGVQAGGADVGETLDVPRKSTCRKPRQLYTLLSNRLAA